MASSCLCSPSSSACLQGCSHSHFLRDVSSLRSSIDVEATDLLTKGDVHEFSNFLVKHQANKYRKAERKLAASGSIASGSGSGATPAAVEGGGGGGGGREKRWELRMGMKRGGVALAGHEENRGYQDDEGAGKRLRGAPW